MSTMRPSLKTTNSPAPADGTCYLAIYNRVKSAKGLLHGRLDGPKADGEHCAVGWYFATPRQMALPLRLIDEVATVNDSMPKGTPKQRRTMMLRWLRWKLGELGMPGFVSAGGQPVKASQTSQPPAKA